MDPWKDFTKTTGFIPISYYSDVSMACAIERCAMRNDWKMFIQLVKYDRRLYGHYNLVWDILELPKVPSEVMEQIK